MIRPTTLAATIQPDAPAKPITPGQRRAVGEFALLTMLGVVAILLVVATAWTLLSRHRRRLQESVRRSNTRGKAKPVDAWTEAGRRVEPDPDDLPPWNADDDTVDLDPPPHPPSDEPPRNPRRPK